MNPEPIIPTFMPGVEWPALADTLSRADVAEQLLRRQGSEIARAVVRQRDGIRLENDVAYWTTTIPGRLGPTFVLVREREIVSVRPRLSGLPGDLTPLWRPTWAPGGPLYMASPETMVKFGMELPEVGRRFADEHLFPGQGLTPAMISLYEWAAFRGGKSRTAAATAAIRSLLDQASQTELAKVAQMIADVLPVGTHTNFGRAVFQVVSVLDRRKHHKALVMNNALISETAGLQHGDTYRNADRKAPSILQPTPAQLIHAARAMPALVGAFTGQLQKQNAASSFPRLSLE
jgi:hypothetical protein